MGAPQKPASSADASNVARNPDTLPSPAGLATGEVIPRALDRTACFARSFACFCWTLLRSAAISCDRMEGTAQTAIDRKSVV